MFSRNFYGNPLKGVYKELNNNIVKVERSIDREEAELLKNATEIVTYGAIRAEREVIDGNMDKFNKLPPIVKNKFHNVANRLHQQHHKKQITREELPNKLHEHTMKIKEEHGLTDPQWNAGKAVAFQKIEKKTLDIKLPDAPGDEKHHYMYYGLAGAVVLLLIIR